MKSNELNQLQIQNDSLHGKLTNMRRRAQRRDAQQGFTLIEIMVVVVIIGILAALIGPQIMSKPDQARVQAAKSQIASLSNALNLYRLDNHNYPSTEQGLEALVKQPSGFPEAKNWDPEGYFANVPEDPWGNPYIYLSPGQEERRYDIISLGADGQEGGEGVAADITSYVNPEEEQAQN